MHTYSFALFETTIGRCGIGWSDSGIVCVQLPEATVRDTKARLNQRLPDTRLATPSAPVRAAIEGISGLLLGKPSDLKRIKLDMSAIAVFHQRVYEVARAIPPGETVTYGDIAHRLGSPGAARAVGQALGRNPFAIIVPCHRVLAANGRLCGFSAHGGTTTKLRLLRIERALD